MSGFCPHDWHGTTEADLQQMAWGQDYDFWADCARADNARLRRQAEAVIAQRRKDYAQLAKDEERHA